MGPRRHLCRVEAGQAMFGMGQAEEGLRILAVGVGDATLLELRRPKLLALAKDPEYADRVVDLLEGWVANISAAVAGEHLLPRESATLLAPATEITAGDRDTVSVQDGTVWVRHLEGSSRFLGHPDLPPIAGEGSVPAGRPGVAGIDRRNHAARLGHAELRGPGRGRGPTWTRSTRWSCRHSPGRRDGRIRNGRNGGTREPRPTNGSPKTPCSGWAPCSRPRGMV